MKVGKKYLYQLPDGRWVSRQRMYQLRRQAEGKCIICAKDRGESSAKLCEECKAKQKFFPSRQKAKE